MRQVSKISRRQVAEKLKQGQSVAPESYENVTVLFSDIVHFAQIARQCSPYQVCLYLYLLVYFYMLFTTFITHMLVLAAERGSSRLTHVDSSSVLMQAVNALRDIQ